jgi:hypothetical protein
LRLPLSARVSERKVSPLYRDGTTGPAVMIYIDASMLRDWDCHEFTRQRYLLNRDTKVPNIYYQYGTAIHRAVESFWQGKTFEQAMADAYAITNQYPLDLIQYQVYQTNKWREMIEQLPDLVAVYYDQVEQDVSKVLQLEQEWSHPYSISVNLCGRIDRLMVGPELPDIKTASEISSMGVPWKTGYQRGKMLEMQFGLYDWYLRQVGEAPKRVYLEVLIKGYKSKPCRMETIELPYVVTDAYRQRFDQQLEWKVEEITTYFEREREQKPWPMAQQLCQSKYGECPYLEICLHGEQPKVMEKYAERVEHLEVRK